jgi:hypothetical protein
MEGITFIFWFVVIVAAALAITLGLLVMPLYVIRACRRYREEYLYRLRLRRAREAAERGGGSDA